MYKKKIYIYIYENPSFIGSFKTIVTVSLPSVQKIPT